MLSGLTSRWLLGHKAIDVEQETVMEHNGSSCRHTRRTRSSLLVDHTAVNDVLQSREPLAAGNDDDDDDRLSLSFHSIDTIIGGVIAMCDRSCRSVVVFAPIVFPVALLQIFNCLSARCAFAASIIRRHHTHTMRDCIAVDDRRWLVLKSVHSSEVNVSNRAHRVNNRVFRPISRSKHYRSAGNIPPWIIAQTIPRSISSTLLQRMR